MKFVRHECGPNKGDVPARGSDAPLTNAATSESPLKDVSKTSRGCPGIVAQSVLLSALRSSHGSLAVPYESGGLERLTRAEAFSVHWGS